MPYVDLHCHLLPGIDDGAAAIADTVAFARRLQGAGVMDVACTPHVKRDEFPGVAVAALAALREQAQQAISGAGLGVRLHGGGELAHGDALALAPEELELIAQGPAEARWLLLECPFPGLDEPFAAAADRLQELGYGLLLAHPERSAGIGCPERQAVLHGLLDRGAMLQVNVSSLLGRHGEVAARMADRLLRDGLVWCLASDGHPGTREDTLDRGRDALKDRGLSEREALRLIAERPGTLLRQGAPRRVAAYAA